jgi:hypothetical protein
MTVDNFADDVDLSAATLPVHRDGHHLRTAVGLSSTAARFLDASVCGGFPASSPASTAAKTTDENLYLMTENDKNDLPVDRVDGGPVPPVERSAS